MFLLFQRVVDTCYLLNVVGGDVDAVTMMRRYGGDGDTEGGLCFFEELEESFHIVILAHDGGKIKNESFVHLVKAFGRNLAEDGSIVEGDGNIDISFVEKESFEGGAFGNLHGVFFVDGFDGSCELTWFAGAGCCHHQAAAGKQGDDDEKEAVFHFFWGRVMS